MTVTKLFCAALLLAASGVCAFESQEGLASWYGSKFQGRRTASGETFDTRQFTAAHQSLPFGTMVLVTNLENGKSTVVRINDRGPFVEGRIIDLSMAAASAIGLTGKGVVPVRIEPPRGEASALAGQAAAAYTLQIGAFRNRANAEALAARLQASGFKPELEEAGSGIIRVLIRHVAAASLSAVQERLTAAGWPEVLVRGDR